MKGSTAKSQADQKVRLPKTPVAPVHGKGHIRTGKAAEGK